MYLVISLCCAFVLLVLITSTAAQGKSKTTKLLDLGEKYLSKLDYEQAVCEYNNVLQIDPYNEEALIGLAKAYAGLGNDAMTKRIFEEELAESENVDVWRSYAEILEGQGNYREAAKCISKVVKKEDSDENQKWLDTVLAKIVRKQYMYSVCNGNVISMDGRTVM